MLILNRDIISYIIFFYEVVQQQI